MANAKTNPPLAEVYRVLFAAWGPQSWWPARSRFEMMTGAILTQNTAWTNVEKAIARLRRARALSPRALLAMPEHELAERIRPAGYFNVKARRLRHFAAWLVEHHGGDIDRMFRADTATLRRELLAVHGIGKETADSILLYAGHRPVFVVDAYTRRFLSRHRWIRATADYDAIAERFHAHFRGLEDRPRAALFNEYHALIVALAKKHCRSRARCEGCPLAPWLP